MMNKIRNTGILFLATMLTALAQQKRTGNFSQALQQTNSDVMSTFTIIRYWLYGGISLVIIVRMIMIMVDNGRGDDKFMKAGSLFAILMIGSIIVWVAESIYG